MSHRFVQEKYWKYIDEGDALVASNAAYDDLINLSIGNPDLNTNQKIIDAAFADASAGHTGYTDFYGDPELRAEIQKKYKDDYNMDLDLEEILVTASGSAAMCTIFATIIESGDEIIIQAPYFYCYINQLEIFGGKIVELPTYEEEDFQVSPDRLETLITPKTKAIILNTPGNPTGNCLTVETMEKIAEIAEKYDIAVISDDIYTSFSYQHPFVPFASLPGMRERTFTVNSCSKDYIMCGWRVGNLIAPKEYMPALVNVSKAMMFCAPSISQRAFLHGLRMRKEIQPPVTELFRERLDYAAKRINETNRLSVTYPPKGSFYLWMNIKETGLSSAEFCKVALEEAHVKMIPGNEFGTCGEGYCRIACMVSIEKLGEAFDRLAKLDILN